MGWLIGPALAAAMLSAFAMYIYDHFLAAGVHSLFASITRPLIAVGVGTSVITVSLLRGFDDRTRWFRRGSKEGGKREKHFPRIKRFW